MNWEPDISPNKGETICYVLKLTPAVKARVVFYGPDGTWYAVLIVAGRRVSNHVKATSEQQAKERAIELVESFQQDIVAALAAVKELS